MEGSGAELWGRRHCVSMEAASWARWDLWKNSRRTGRSRLSAPAPERFARPSSFSSLKNIKTRLVLSFHQTTAVLLCGWHTGALKLRDALPIPSELSLQRLQSTNPHFHTCDLPVCTIFEAHEHDLFSYICYFIGSFMSGCKSRLSSSPYKPPCG